MHSKGRAKRQSAPILTVTIIPSGSKGGWLEKKGSSRPGADDRKKRGASLVFTRLAAFGQQPTAEKKVARSWLLRNLFHLLLVWHV